MSDARTTQSRYALGAAARAEKQEASQTNACSSQKKENNRSCIKPGCRFHGNLRDILCRYTFYLA